MKKTASSVKTDTRKASTETKATRKSKKVSEAAPKTASVEEFPAYNEEAWKWMAGQSIAGAYSPIMYIGLEVSNQIAAILGRSMTLEEAQYLVKVDGPFIMCAYTGVEFQPVEYVFRVPPGLKEKLATGLKLTDCPLVTGGAFYPNKKTGDMMALSGSVFTWNPRGQRYEWCKSSPLVIAAEEARKMVGFMKWGAPSHQVQIILGKKKEAKDRRNKIASLMAEAFAPERHSSRFGIGGQVEDAVRRGGQKDHRNGRRPKHHEIAED